MTDWDAVIDATWPAAITDQFGPFIFRRAPGGGNRVNAATATRPVTAAEVDAAARLMRTHRQDAVFRVGSGDDVFDALLESLGYVARDATLIRACKLALLTQHPVPPVTAFTVWPPLAVQREIWAAGDIGPKRLEIMDRSDCPKTTFLGRASDHPAGTVFAAVKGNTAMIHALEIALPYRRKGLAAQLSYAAAIWAQRHRATQVSLLVTAANTAANALYEGLGLSAVGGYHYRMLPKELP